MNPLPEMRLLSPEKGAVNDHKLRAPACSKVQSPSNAVSINNVHNLSCDRPASRGWKVEILKSIEESNLILFVKQAIEP